MPRRTNFCIELDRIKKSAVSMNDSAQEELTSSIIKFAKSGSYIHKKNVGEVLSCWGMTDKEVSEETGLGAANIRLIRQKISDALYDKFGEDFISLLGSGEEKNLQECERRFRVVRANKKVSDYIPAVFIKEVVEVAKDRDFSLRSDCKAEFEFIKKYSFASFRKDLQSIDMDKVAYVLRVLDQKAGSMSETDFLRRSIDSVFKDETPSNQGSVAVGKRLSI